MATTNPFRIETDLSLKPSQADLRKLQKEIETALNSSSADRFDKSVANVASRLKQAYIQATKLDQQMKNIQSGSIKTDWVKDTEQDLKFLENELKQVEKAYKGVNATSTEGRMFADQAAQIRQEMEMVKNSLVDYYKTKVDKSPEMAATKDAASLLSDRVSVLLHDFEALQQKSTQQDGIPTLKEDFRSFASEIPGATKQMAKFAARLVITKPIKLAASSLWSLTKAAAALAKQKLSKLFNRKSVDDYSNSLKHGLKTLLRYGLGVRSLFFLFRRLRSAFVEGMKSLVQYDASINKSVSSMTSAFKELKYSLATAFAPVVTVVAPYVTYLIRLMNSALNAIGMFFAALTGQKTFTKVVEVQEDYAASLQDTTKETKKATKAAKDYLSPIDEINRLEKDTIDDTGAGGIGGAGAGPAVNYEQVPITSKFQDIAKKLKDYIRSEDWEGLGAYVANGINLGLQKIYDTISWDNVGPRITYFVNAFTTTFNSLVDNIDWDLLGRTIAAGINTIVNTLVLLIEGIDWVNLGRKFAEGLYGLLDEFDALQFGRLLADKFMIIPSIIYGIIDQMAEDNTFKLAGQRFGEIITGLITNIDLGMIGEAIGKLFTGIGEFLKGAAEKIDWEAVGTKIADGLNNFFKNFDVNAFFDGLEAFIDGVFIALDTAISKTDWKVVGEKLIQFICRAVILVIKTGAYLLVLGIELIAGLVQGLFEAIADVDWSAVWGKIWEGIKSFFGVHSPSTLFAGLGKNLILGLVQGIGDWAGGVVDKFVWLKDKIGEKWDNLKESAKKKWDGIKETVKERASTTAEETSKKWDTFKDNLSTTWDTVKDKSKDKFGTMKDNILDAWDAIKKSSKPAWEGIWGVIKKPINGIIGFINAMVRGVVSALNSIGGVLNNFQIDIPDWVPIFGGGTFGFNIPHFTAPQIPLLAQGAVIPPNKAFMAVLGDQKRGNNIEAPESLIRRIVREESQNNSNNTYRIVLEVGGRQLLEAVLDEADLKQRRSGINPFELA